MGNTRDLADVGGSTRDGTSGYLWTANGAGSMPTWQAPQPVTRAVDAGVTSGTITPDASDTDVLNAFGLTGAITIDTPIGSPADGQRLTLRLKDDGTARSITWTTTSDAFRAVGITLPTTTVAGKITYIGCVYNSTDNFWDVVALVTQA